MGNSWRRSQLEKETGISALPLKYMWVHPSSAWFSSLTIQTRTKTVRFTFAQRNVWAQLQYPEQTTLVAETINWRKCFLWNAAWQIHTVSFLWSKHNSLQITNLFTIKFVIYLISYPLPFFFFFGPLAGDLSFLVDLRHLVLFVLHRSYGIAAHWWGECNSYDEVSQRKVS